MIKIAVAILLLAPVLARAEKPAPNPADYTIAVHVQLSHTLVQCGDVTNGSSFCVYIQHLAVLIEGRKYELDGAVRDGDLLRIGDYKAKIHKEDTKHAYEYLRIYEFLFADGTTRDYRVVGEE